MMRPQPTFDSEGYPTEETLDAIRRWPHDDPSGWIWFVIEAWDKHYGRIVEEYPLLRMATGGWSANESINSAMLGNPVLWAMLWESSHRGGLTVLRCVKVP